MGSRVMKKKTYVPTLATPRKYIDGDSARGKTSRSRMMAEGHTFPRLRRLENILMGKGAREDAGKAGGARFSYQQPPINPGGAREVAGQLFTSFSPTQGGHKNPGALYEGPGPAGPAEQKQKVWA